MQVNCKCHNKKIERDTAYKIVINNKNQYYCNEQEYINIQNTKKIKDDTYNTINNVFGYKVVNTALFKEINEILTISTYDNITNYIKSNYKFLCDVMSKDFNNEYCKIRYFSTIIKNNIKDFQNQIKTEPIKHTDIEVYDIKFKPKSRRKCLSDYEEGEER